MEFGRQIHLTYSIFENSTTGATALTIKRENGNVGIGTNDPTQKLEVDGTILASHLSIGNNTTVSGNYHPTCYWKFKYLLLVIILPQ